ncbi:MAG: hypothetical protein JNM59_02095 [Hyphomonadaceae bacterium]|nr:hypothetical protein [Hyphomonadaceae bacterium]
MGGLDDAGFIGVAWAMIAAVAGGGLAVAAMTLARNVRFLDRLEFDGGYNALAHVTD